MTKTKVAVIGLGGIAQLVHLPYLTRIENVEITAVADVNKSRLITIADKFNIKERYKDHNELLANSDTGTIIIATPTNTHKEIAIACLKANRDVLVEKPLARTYNESKQIVDAAKKYKRKIMVGMNLRYRPDAMILKSLVSAGEIGQPFYIKCGWLKRQSSSQKWFTKKEESGGGVIIDLSILLLDMALWLLNFPPIISVTAQSYYHNTKTVEDTSVSFLRCADSSCINIESSWSLSRENDFFYFDVYGTKGSASLNPFQIHKKIEDQLIDLTPSQNENALNLFKKSYMNELKSFIGAVNGLNPVFSSADDSLSRMEVIEAMYKSSAQKKEIKL
jgi:predicted dehydrogenase